MTEMDNKTYMFTGFNLKKAVIITLCTVLGTGALTTGGVCMYVNSYNEIYPNVTVGGIDVGGTDVSAATERVKNTFEDMVKGNITLSLDGVNKTFEISALGAELDFEKTVKTAHNTGREGNVFQKAAAYFSPEVKDVPVAVECRADMIDRALNEISMGKETAVIQRSYEIKNNKLCINQGKPGYMVNRQTAKQKIEEAISGRSNSPLVLNLESITPDELDADKLFVDITEPPENAYYARNDNNEIVVMPSRPKVEISKSELQNILTSPGNIKESPVKLIEAAVTAEKLKAQLFRDQLSTYTTSFNAADTGRSSNVRNAARKINNHTLLPGEEFSYDKTVGPRTAANGFKIAHVYVGNKVEDGLGGGICQISSTLYCSILYADLQITQRHNHSLPVAYVPGGQDATIAEGYLDLKFKNNTNYPIKIVTSSGNNTVAIKIMGTRDVDRKVEIINSTSNPTQFKTVTEYDESIPIGTKRISQKGANGFTVTSYRVVKENGREIKNEFLSKSVYLAMDRIEVINPADKFRDWSITPANGITDTEKTEIDGAEISPPEVTEDEKVPDTTPKPDTTESDTPEPVKTESIDA